MLYPLKNLQFSMNTVGPHGPSGGERVKDLLSAVHSQNQMTSCLFLLWTAQNIVLYLFSFKLSLIIEFNYYVGLIRHAEGHGPKFRPRSKFHKTLIAYCNWMVNVTAQ